MSLSMLIGFVRLSGAFGSRTAVAGSLLISLGDRRAGLGEVVPEVQPAVDWLEVRARQNGGPFGAIRLA